MNSLKSVDTSKKLCLLLTFTYSTKPCTTVVTQRDQPLSKTKFFTIMKKSGSLLIVAAVSLFFACKSGNKEYKSEDTSMMTTPDTSSMDHTNNMNNMPADTMRTDTAMKK